MFANRANINTKKFSYFLLAEPKSLFLKKNLHSHISIRRGVKNEFVWLWCGFFRHNRLFIEDENITFCVLIESWFCFYSFQYSIPTLFLNLYWLVLLLIVVATKSGDFVEQSRLYFAVTIYTSQSWVILNYSNFSSSWNL